MKKIAVIGIGKLGKDLAEVIFDSGHDVVGYDIEKRDTKFPMKATIQETIYNRDIIFIAAPTPHYDMYGGELPVTDLPTKDFDYSIVKNILFEINKVSTKSQLIVLISTTLPGTVRSILAPIITNSRFVYNPYIISLGSVKKDTIYPEMVIIGTDKGNKNEDVEELINFYKTFISEDTRYEVGTWDEAESIKIFYNAFISMKIAFANMIQDVAEANGNINVDVVTDAIKKSTNRIMSPSYMTAGLGDGGACRPRDSIVLKHLFEKLNLEYNLIGSIVEAREMQAKRIAKKCLEYGKNICVVGKSYKSNINCTNGSVSLLIGNYITELGGSLYYYDIYTGDTVFLNVDVYFISYWDNYVENLIFPEHAVVIDPWRKITNKQHKGKIVHYGNTRQI